MQGLGLYDFKETNGNIHLNIDQMVVLLSDHHPENVLLHGRLSELKKKGKTIGCNAEVYNSLKKDFWSDEGTEKFMRAMGVYSDVALHEIVGRANLGWEGREIVYHVIDGMRPEQYLKKRNTKMEKLKLS